ncbi:hypothetical protein BJY16_006614 [Actinoplanes octamycinicus]|uniref:Uncharacterized protein n=1 Tax=Actinoplanes octamycinicus TaxID=135948 RepID=A0A7W7H392_9ACTN|nr:hypothetical protein [Actinoplanes octamycinicus]MBB4743155.1 hypothetical protein [Actinoplanes octamycinicus]GIE61283.1 hypothetical protein Aoc01nite_66850 [Actinoplanes octamycinicus]
MTNPVAGSAPTSGRDWWSVGTVLGANGVLMAVLLAQAMNARGNLFPFFVMLEPEGLSALALGLAVALLIAGRQRATARPPVAGVGRGIVAAALGWVVAFGLVYAASMIVFWSTAS